MFLCSSIHAQLIICMDLSSAPQVSLIFHLSMSTRLKLTFHYVCTFQVITSVNARLITYQYLSSVPQVSLIYHPSMSTCLKPFLTTRSLFAMYVCMFQVVVSVDNQTIIYLGLSSVPQVSLIHHLSKPPYLTTHSLLTLFHLSFTCVLITCPQSFSSVSTLPTQLSLTTSVCLFPCP